MSTNHLGEFEELVLLSVAALDGDGYGRAVRDFLEQQGRRKASLGAIHATLYRLQDKGLLASSLDGATEVRGGRRKRLFRLTGTGLASIRAARELRERMWSVMPPHLKPGTTS